jgi:hypothetical protein
VPFDDPVARVDRRALADLDVPRLGLGDFQLRLQLVPLDDFGERRAGRIGRLDWNLPRRNRRFR